jgi:hypothetical protein
MWQWNRVNPGLSATKSIAAVLRCAMLNVKNSGIAGKGLTAEGLTISVARKPGTRLISAAGEGYKGVQTQANLKADLAVWKRKTWSGGNEIYKVTLAGTTGKPPKFSPGSRRCAGKSH